MADRYRDFPQRTRTGQDMDKPDWDERWRREREQQDEDERSRFSAGDRDEEDRTRSARERYGVGERWGERDYPRFGAEYNRPSRGESSGSRGGASSRWSHEEPYGSQQYIGYGNPLSSSYAGMGERMEGYSGGPHGRWGTEGSGRGSTHESRFGREREYEREGSVGQKMKRFFGMGPKGYKRSDQRIHEDVCDTLMEDDDVDASNIEVRVQSCEVMLSGTVEDRQQKRRAEDLAERVRGVSDVRNELRVSQRTEAMGEGVRISGTPTSTGNGNRNRVS